MRKSIWVVALLVSGCVTPEQKDREKNLKQMGQRVGEICSLSGAEREAALEKMKAETGMSVFCGKD